MGVRTGRKSHVLSHGTVGGNGEGRDFKLLSQLAVVSLDPGSWAPWSLWLFSQDCRSKFMLTYGIEDRLRAEIETK